jgi:hypothetical protein
LLLDDETKDSEWRDNFYGVEIDFANENHQKQSELYGELCFNLENGQTITLKKNRFDEVNTVEFIDNIGAAISPIMQVETDIAGDSIYVPLFNTFSRIRFSNPKTKEIQLYHYDNNDRKWSPLNVHWEKMSNGDFYCNSKIDDGIYQICDKRRVSKREILAVLSDFQKLHEKYNDDNSEFEVAFILPKSGKLKTKRQENQYLQIQNDGNIFRFKKSTLYPLAALTWEWNDTKLGAFTLYFPIKGLRWRSISKSQENSFDFRWTDEPIIVNPGTIPFGQCIELHLPEKTNIVINGNLVKQVSKINNGGRWEAQLNDYRNSEKIILTLNDKEIPLVYFAKQPIIEKFEWTASDDIAEIKWTGNVPENAVLLIWNPLKPSSSFREISLPDNTTETLIDNIDSKTFYCFTIAAKGWRGQYYVAVVEKFYKHEILRSHIGLSQEKKDGFEYHFHFYLLFQNLLDEKFAKDFPFDYAQHLRAEIICKDEKEKEIYFNVLKIFCEEMKNLDEYFKKTLNWDNINKEFGIERYVELAGKWLPSLIDLVENNNSKESIRETFIEETKSGMNFSWLKPYQIAEYDCVDDKWERYADCPTPFGYFRDLWLISSTYHQVKILSTCAEKNNCPCINKSQFEKKVTHWRFYNECNSCESFDDHKAIPIKHYIKCQQAALQRLLNFHEKFPLPSLQKLTPINSTKKFDIPLNDNNFICAMIKRYNEEELSQQLGLDNSEVLLVNWQQRNLCDQWRTGNKFEYNPHLEKSQVLELPLFRDKFFDDKKHILKRFDPAVPLIAKVDKLKWLETHVEQFRTTLDRLTSLSSTTSSFTLSANDVSYLTDILDVENVLFKLVENICEQSRPQEKILKLGGNESSVKINSGTANETIKQLWRHAVLERLFVNDSASIKEKLGKETSQKLVQYLRETTSEIYMNNSIVYYPIQALAELAVRVCYLGGIGTLAKTEFN